MALMHLYIHIPSLDVDRLRNQPDFAASTGKVRHHDVSSLNALWEVCHRSGEPNLLLLRCRQTWHGAFLEKDGRDSKMQPEDQTVPAPQVVPPAQPVDFSTMDSVVKSSHRAMILKAEWQMEPPAPPMEVAGSQPASYSEAPGHSRGGAGYKSAMQLLMEARAGEGRSAAHSSALQLLREAAAAPRRGARRRPRPARAQRRKEPGPKVEPLPVLEHYYIHKHIHRHHQQVVGSREEALRAAEEMRNATEASLQRTFKPRSRPQEVSRSTSLPVLSSSR
ncbi:unnamed protein product [Durusdinium trenchii]|uniref:Uncharacterized protein n=1 Tax=Durusdinium trenchii TaxID=1381693 RepID=A0ABP0I604_9DINO